jgi:hypothetical protein
VAQDVRRNLARVEATLEARKAAELSPVLGALDRARADREAGRLSVGDYVERLAASAPDAVSPVVKNFLSALADERTLDFEAAEKERAAVLSTLASRLDDGDKNRLIAWSLGFRTGESK